MASLFSTPTATKSGTTNSATTATAAPTEDSRDLDHPEFPDNCCESLPVLGVRSAALGQRVLNRRGRQITHFRENRWRYFPQGWQNSRFPFVASRVGIHRVDVLCRML